MILERVAAAAAVPIIEAYLSLAKMRELMMAMTKRRRGSMFGREGRVVVTVVCQVLVSSRHAPTPLQGAMEWIHGVSF